MTQYQYTVNLTTVTGGLTWNANGTLNQLAITAVSILLGNGDGTFQTHVD